MRLTGDGEANVGGSPSRRRRRRIRRATRMTATISSPVRVSCSSSAFVTALISKHQKSTISAAASSIIRQILLRELASAVKPRNDLVRDGDIAAYSPKRSRSKSLLRQRPGEGDKYRPLVIPETTDTTATEDDLTGDGPVRFDRCASDGRAKPQRGNSMARLMVSGDLNRITAQRPTFQKPVSVAPRLRWHGGPPVKAGKFGVGFEGCQRDRVTAEHLPLPMSAFDRFTDSSRTSRHFRNVPHPDSCTAANMHRHSITSSARPRSVSGKVRPSVLAVLRLIINCTFVDC
jgi:hypothetical protein